MSLVVLNCVRAVSNPITIEVLIKVITIINYIAETPYYMLKCLKQSYNQGQKVLGQKLQSTAINC